MKKVFIISVLSILISFSSFPQVGGIKNGSNNNSTPKSNGSDVKGGSGCLADACALGCNSGCFDFILQNIILGGIKYHKEILTKHKDIPEITSIELMPQFGFASPSSALLLPRIRGNWGLFSTDFRYSNMMDFGTPATVDYYSTLDWQILELNFLVTKPVIARIGSGIMYENYSYKTFIEHFLGVDINIKDHQYLINCEFRVAEDYNTGATPRLEGNLRLNYRIFQSKNLNAYMLAGAIFQKYYSSVDVWTVQTGFEFNFH